MRTERAGAWGWAKTSIGFKPEYLNFDRGIRVGNLEPHERITRILKAGLETRYRQEFVTERWGRGVFWIWIGFLNRSNRNAKPISSHVSFGCSKFFVMVDTDDRLFKCGLQVERGYLRAPADARACRLRSDWDWHRLVNALTPRGALERELKRLTRDGFMVHAGSWSEPHEFSRKNLPGAVALRRLLGCAPANEWCGFQLYYAMAEQDVRRMSGPDLIETMVAIFEEVRPAMDLTMQAPLGGRTTEGPRKDHGRTTEGPRKDHGRTTEGRLDTPAARSSRPPHGRHDFAAGVD